MLITRPAPDEFAQWYADYIAEVPGDDALTVLTASCT